MKKVLLTISLFLIANVQLFAQVDSGARATANRVWGYIQLGSIFFFVAATVIGGVIVYQKKSSGNNEEFKKAVLNYIYGIVFLLFVMGMISVIKSMVTSSTNVTF